MKNKTKQKEDMAPDNFIPLGNRVLLHPEPEPVSHSLLVELPESSKGPFQYAIVVSKGQSLSEHDVRMDKLFIGMRVLVNRRAGVEIEIGDIKYKLVDMDNLLGFLPFSN